MGQDRHGLHLSSDVLEVERCSSSDWCCAHTESPPNATAFVAYTRIIRTLLGNTYHRAVPAGAARTRPSNPPTPPLSSSSARHSFHFRPPARAKRMAVADATCRRGAAADA